MALHPAADSQIALAYKFDLSNQWLAWLMKSTHKSAGGSHFNGQPAIHSHKPYEVVKNIVIHGPKRSDFKCKTAIDGPEPCKFISSGHELPQTLWIHKQNAIDSPKPYEFIGKLAIRQSMAPNPINS